MLSRMRVDTTDREDTPVLYAASPGEREDIPGAAQRAWRDLEAAVQPKGRKAYGYWSPQDREYRACFSLHENDEPAALGLGQTVLPGGRYRRARLKGEDVYGKIGPTFDELAKAASIDETRPWLEFYRRQDEVDVLVPITSEG
jgi:DNA gyrase inhibitor GyrI